MKNIISLAKSKYDKILQKHCSNSGEKVLYKHMQKQLVWFINKGYIKKGLKTIIKDNDLNAIIDSAIKISDNEVHRIRIAFKVVNNTIIIKSFYIISSNKK